MSERTWRFHAHRTAWDGLELYARRGDNDVVGFTLEPRTPGLLSKALMTSSDVDEQDNASDAMNFLRAALNCAWDMGLRPDGFNDTRESMAATKQHLEDMRQLAFYKIGAAKP